jgi:hypothetical protein
MRTFLSILATLTFASSFGLFGCGGDDDGGGEHEDPDIEGCEHLTEGPYVELTASAAPDAAAPWVAANHMSHTIALTPGTPGYVLYESTLAGDAYLFLDQSIGVKVFAADTTEVTLESSATSSEACAEVKGRHVVELDVGTYYFELTAGDGLTSVNLVIEASDHAH